MRRYEFVGHIADARMKISGDSLEELFAAGMEGMFEFAKTGCCSDFATPNPPAGGEGRVSEIIKITSADTTALLVDFLSELLTLSHEKKAVFCRVKFMKLTETELEAEVSGAPVDSFDEDIKAVTYHEANIVKTPSGVYETNIVFDI